MTLKQSTDPLFWHPPAHLWLQHARTNRTEIRTEKTHHRRTPFKDPQKCGSRSPCGTYGYRPAAYSQPRWQSKRCLFEKRFAEGCKDTPKDEPSALLSSVALLRRSAGRPVRFIPPDPLCLLQLWGSHAPSWRWLAAEESESESELHLLHLIVPVRNSKGLRLGSTQSSNNTI